MGNQIAGKVKAWARALTGPTSLPDKYPQLVNPPRLRNRARTDRHLGQITKLFRRRVRFQVSMDDEFKQAYSVRLDWSMIARANFRFRQLETSLRRRHNGRQQFLSHCALTPTLC